MKRIIALVFPARFVGCAGAQPRGVSRRGDDGNPWPSLLSEEGAGEYWLFDPEGQLISTETRGRHAPRRGRRHPHQLCRRRHRAALHRPIGQPDPDRSQLLGHQNSTALYRRRGSDHRWLWCRRQPYSRSQEAIRWRCDYRSLSPFHPRPRHLQRRHDHRRGLLAKAGKTPWS